MRNPADEAFAATLCAAVPGLDLIPAEPRYTEEQRRRRTGNALFVARPRTTSEAAALVRHASVHRVGLAPFGGGTGLVWGHVTTSGPPPLIVSLERMSAIRAVYPEENVLVAEAGTILESVHEAAGAVNRLFPLTLASQGSARIGGVLSTNAGGVNVLRYGNARDLCLGIEAVLPDGTILHGLKRLRKDNTGYDLRHLLIGAEGTLGLITAAALRLHPLPAATGTALLTVASPEAALELLSRAEGRMAGCVTAFELIARQGLEFLATTMPELRQPFDPLPLWCVLIEVGLPEGSDPVAALGALFAEAAEAGLCDDGLVAGSSRQAADFWALREALPLANKRIGAIASHDISLPLSAIPRFLAEIAPAIAAIAPLRINCFGHLGDGNLHYNIFPPEGRAAGEFSANAGQVTRAVHDLVDRLGGSISAEHGIGRLKVADLERYGDPAKLRTMRAIKAALDPFGIMNPGAVLSEA